MVKLLHMASEEITALTARIEAALVRIEGAVARRPASIEADAALLERNAQFRAATADAVSTLNALIDQAKAEG